MTTTARVVVLPQHSSELKIESIELPEPGAEQVVVKQFASEFVIRNCTKSTAHATTQSFWATNRPES